MRAARAARAALTARRQLPVSVASTRAQHAAAAAGEADAPPALKDVTLLRRDALVGGCWLSGDAPRIDVRNPGVRCSSRYARAAAA
jgi:hypothetical protein